MRRRGRTGWVGAAFVAPFAVLFAATYLVPVGHAIQFSLFRTRSSGLGLAPPTTHFAWFANYVDALQDPGYRDSLGRVVLILLGFIPALIALPVLMALLLDATRGRLRSFFRTVYFLPYGVPGVIGSLVWAYLYTPGISPVVAALGHAGVHVNFLDSSTVLWSIVNVVTWEFAGYNMLIIYAALLAIPADVIEAARVDGASERQIAMRVKLPLVRPAIVLVGVFTAIGGFQIFAEPLVLRTIAPAITANYTPNLSAYTEAFANNNTNLAAAEAVLLAVLAFVLSFGLMRATRQGAFVR
ncbi:MAG: sugar ABC transporter permease [Actinomycetota bacterium]|nr:sugar ABC transporter permease [Actinomycetota bacterium]